MALKPKKPSKQRRDTKMEVYPFAMPADHYRKVELPVIGKTINGRLKAPPLKP